MRSRSRSRRRSAESEGFWQESVSESELECLWGRSRESDLKSEFLKGWSLESESESELLGLGVGSQSRSPNSK